MLHPLLEAVFRDFEAAGAHWCVLRGELSLAGRAGGRDVDLLVDQADTEVVRSVLRAHQFASYSSWGRGMHAFFVGYHPPTETWVKLDIVTELAYGLCLELRTDAAHGCLARRQRSGVLYTLSPDDAFWTMLLHCLLDKHIVAPHQSARLQELAGVVGTDSQLAQWVAQICPPGWNAERLIESVRRGMWMSLLRLAPTLKTRWRRQDPIRIWVRAVMNRALWLPETMLARLRRPGISVVLLGPDGAGKSTLAAGIRRSFYSPVHQVYMGVWPRTRARQLAASAPRLPGMRAAFGAFGAVTHLPLLWWHYLTTPFHVALGRTVIFDRYVYDSHLFTRQSVGWLKWLYLRLLPPANPAPDLVLLLDVPGEVMYSRKGEFSPEYLENQQQALLALGRSLVQLQTVDATRDAGAVRAEVMGRIWSRCCAQWSRRAQNDALRLVRVVPEPLTAPRSPALAETSEVTSIVDN